MEKKVKDKDKEKKQKEELPTPGDTITLNDVVENAEGPSAEDKKAFLDAKLYEFKNKIEAALKGDKK